ncbi:hypothetical protein LshimejAT787_0701620 [Lyophyllum shimeji]|uniref:Uncharacterized protein n=1 Tax=Lyophyllum shimeji TaxID=47721 RepID=A0A9P3PNG8_LYOSH|nr:hypothetical protein LshimejAT787_0701620 [Lyophyllum shimeji]
MARDFMPAKDGYMHPMKLEKPDAPKYVILATVKWREVPPAVGQMRETQLNIAWKKMLDRGSRIARFGDTTESARAIIDMFENPTTVEEILKELNHILGRLPKDTVDKKSGAGFISKLFGRLWGTS